jgi:hypothetical protein
MSERNSIIYSLKHNGDLMWYHHNGNDDGSFMLARNEGKKVGHGLNSKQVFSGGGGIIYAINENKDLMWGRHEGRNDGSFSWTTPNMLKVGHNWNFKQVFSGGDGIIYAINDDNDLMWARHEGRYDGSFTWATSDMQKVGHGWDFKQVFSGGEGIIYAINDNNDLMWARHEGRYDGSFRWTSDMKKVASDWDFDQVFSGNNGVIYAIERLVPSLLTPVEAPTGGKLRWYRHEGRNDGTDRWAAGSGKQVADRWTAFSTVFSGGFFSDLPARLQFRLRGFVEYESTDNTFEGASDEVYMSAIGVDSAAVLVGSDGKPYTEPIEGGQVGDVSSDNVRGPWENNPYVLIEFDLRRPSSWPRSFTVTLLIVEYDNENLAETLAKLRAEVGNEVKRAAVNAASAAAGALAGAAVGSVIPGIGTVVGAAIGAIAGATYDFIIGEIAEGLANELFRPLTLVLEVGDPERIREHSYIGRPLSIDVHEHGAHYGIGYDWHFG